MIAVGGSILQKDLQNENSYFLISVPFSNMLFAEQKFDKFLVSVVSTCRDNNFVSLSDDICDEIELLFKR